MFTALDVDTNKLLNDAELSKIKLDKVIFSYYLNQLDTKICYLFYYVKNKDEFLHELTIGGFKNGIIEYINVFLKYYCIALDKLIKKELIKFDFICRVLSHDELVAKELKPLDIFCKKLSRNFRIKYEDKFLLKRRINKKFSTLNRDDRVKEMTNNYYCNKKIECSQNSVILIVDDVITSGTSANEIIRAIRISYPKSTIYFISITKTVGNYNANDIFFKNVELKYDPSVILD